MAGWLSTSTYSDLVGGEGQLEFPSLGKQKSFCNSLSPDRFWGPPSLLPSGDRGHFPRSVKLTTYFRTGVEVKNMWSCTSIVLYSFKSRNSFQQKDNFSLLDAGEWAASRSGCFKAQEIGSRAYCDRGVVRPITVQAEMQQRGKCAQ
jgi:hypothetical protein